MVYFKAKLMNSGACETPQKIHKELPSRAET
jgi:hypothetical protein